MQMASVEEVIRFINEKECHHTRGQKCQKPEKMKISDKVERAPEVQEEHVCTDECDGYDSEVERFRERLECQQSRQCKIKVEFDSRWIQKLKDQLNRL